MTVLSPKQQEMRERDERILLVAKGVLLEHGYHGFTMDRLADAADCPKATMYRRFKCKEDVVLALAEQCLHRRGELLKRAAAYEGKSRERLLALGEAMALFSRLHPADAQIIHLAQGSPREKVSPTRLSAVVKLEQETVDLIQQIVLDGLAEGEITLPEGTNLAEVAFAFCSLVDGGFALIQARFPQDVLGMENPFHRLWRTCNFVADSYNWRPLFHEWDWEKTLSDIRRSVFPEEAQELYGVGHWYGDDA
jgi:AcrR family transcriptional regulator